MAYNFIPKHANKVNGLVYFGASILIIVVGLRGLGSLAGKVSVIPSFLIGPDGKIDPTWVLLALLVEFTMLLLLGFVTFFTPADSVAKPQSESVDLDISKLKDNLRDLKYFADEEIKIVEDYLDKFNNLSKKVNLIQAVNLSAVKKMKETIEN
jgi:hypothetical protein